MPPMGSIHLIGGQPRLRGHVDERNPRVTNRGRVDCFPRVRGVWSRNITIQSGWRTAEGSVGGGVGNFSLAPTSNGEKIPNNKNAIQ